MVVAAVASGIASGCTGAVNMPGGLEAAAAQTNTYALRTGDKLKVAVFNEPDLSGEFQVGNNGNIGFPLIGEIKAAGLPVNAFRSALETKLREGFVRNPRITVDIVNFQPVNVTGEVRNAGQYAYRPGLSLQDAIAMAGGYTYRANTSTVYIRRADLSNEISVPTGGNKMTILPGDNVRVPERYF